MAIKSSNPSAISHRGSKIKVNMTKKKPVKRKITEVTKKTRAISSSRTGHQQEGERIRNSNRTMPKTKSVSSGTTRKKSQSSNSIKRNSKGRVVSYRSVSKSSSISIKKSTASPKPRPRYTVAQKRLITSIPRIGTAESRAKELIVAKSFPITGGSVKKQEEIVAAISDNFTVKEIKTMSDGTNRPVVKVSTVGGGADASHERKIQGNSNPPRDNHFKRS